MEIPEDEPVLTEFDFNKIKHDIEYGGKYIFTKGVINSVSTLRNKKIGGTRYLTLRDSSNTELSLKIDYNTMKEYTNYTNELEEVLRTMKSGDTIEVVVKAKNGRYRVNLDCITISL